jgi:hypothetical protein
MPDRLVESAQFDIPASPSRNIYQINRFLGADFTSSPSAVDANHSSDCINFIRYQPGKIRKRMGYESIASGSGQVFGIWKWDDDNYVVHIGTTMYHIGRNASGNLDFSVIDEDTDTPNSQILTNASGTRRIVKAKEYGYIRSGNQALVFGNGEIYIYTNDGKLYDTTEYQLYVPTVTISKKPQGGGTSYEPFNLIGTKFNESFYVSSNDATETDFYLSVSDITDITDVLKLNANGVFETLVRGTDYTVDVANSKVTFMTAPGVSPVEGEDNIVIEATKTISGSFEKIANCTFAIAYGINGNYDRIFISGNPDYPNFDWYSQKDDITYFQDTSYSVLGSDASPIKGYAIVSNQLVTLKGNGSDRQAAIIRAGSVTEDGEVVFKVIKSLQGYPIIAPKSSIVTGIEPMFLSQEGVMAVTLADIYGDYLMNSRSYYLNGKLLEEPNLDKAFAIRNGDFYMLFVNSHVYILDTLQVIAADGAPYSTRQYATFYWDNVPATCAISIDETVFFGTADGHIMRFHTNYNDITNYSDNGKAIYCRYDTADIDELVFFKAKTYRYFALRVFPSAVSSVNVYALRNGAWELLKSDSTTIRYFTFSQLVFSKFTFRADKGTQMVSSKLRLKKLDHVRFRIENNQLNEPLMIDQFGIEYTQNNNCKN